MIECRGRNGWFNYHSHNIFNLGAGISIGLYSNRRGKMPPIMLTGPRDEILKLLDQLIEEINKGG